MYPAFAEGRKSLSSFQNEGKKMGACLTLHGVFWHLGGGFHVLQELNTSDASPSVAWLQQDGKWGQEKTVSRQSLFSVALGCSCEQIVGDQKMLPSLPPSLPLFGE